MLCLFTSDHVEYTWETPSVFDGTSYPASEWLIDFDSYMAVTGRKSDEERKHSLTMLLTADAKAWLRLQPKETRASYKLIRKRLQNRFSPSEDELFNRKWALYGIRQAPGQPFAQYLQALQETALDTGVDQAELVNIAIAGAQQALKPHLAGSTATTIDELRAIPAIQPGNDPSHAIDPAIIAAVIAQLNISNTAAAVSAPTNHPKRVAFEDRSRRRTHDRDRSRKSSRSGERSNSRTRTPSRDRSSGSCDKRDGNQRRQPSHWNIRYVLQAITHGIAVYSLIMKCTHLNLSFPVLPCLFCTLLSNYLHVL